MISENVEKTMQKANEVMQFLSTKYTLMEVWDVLPFITAAYMFTVHRASKGKIDLNNMLETFIPLVKDLYELLEIQRGEK